MSSVSLVSVSLSVTSLSIMRSVSVFVRWVISILLTVVMPSWLFVLMFRVFVESIGIVFGTIIIWCLIDFLCLSKLLSFVFTQTPLVFSMEIIFILWNKDIVQPSFVISSLTTGLIFWLIVPLVNGFFHAQLFGIHFFEDILDGENSGSFDIVYLIIVPNGCVGLLIEGHAIVIDGLDQRAYHEEIKLYS